MTRKRRQLTDEDEGQTTERQVRQALQQTTAALGSNDTPQKAHASVPTDGVTCNTFSLTSLTVEFERGERSTTTTPLLQRRGTCKPPGSGPQFDERHDHDGAAPGMMVPAC